MKFFSRILRYRAWPYRLRFVALVLVCVVLNVAGLLSTQEIGWSILFFDMVGTAVASMLSGAAAGIFVALITGGVGTYLLGRPAYALFSIVNVYGALLWAIAPRTGMHILGGQMFDPSFPRAYRRGMTNILALGLVVGVVCSVVSFFIQAYVLNMKLNANIVPLTEFSGGTATSLNNIRMALSLDRMFGGGAFSRDIILLIASSISNVPDKIIATVSAVFLIFSFGTLPNYIRQKEVMRKYAHLKNCKVIDNRVLLMFLLILPIAVLPIITFRVTRNPTAVIIMVALCAAAALFSAADRAYLRSIDRGNPNKLEGTEGIFFVIPEDFELKRQKDIFEDTLKMMVVLGSGLSFGIAAIGGTNVCASSETLTALSGCSLLYRLAVVNILILTAYRYSFMILIRMGGRV